MVKVVGGVGNSGQGWGRCVEAAAKDRWLWGDLGRSAKVTVCGIRRGQEAQVPELSGKGLK